MLTSAFVAVPYTGTMHTLTVDESFAYFILYNNYGCFVQMELLRGNLTDSILLSTEIHVQIMCRKINTNSNF